MTIPNIVLTILLMTNLNFSINQVTLRMESSNEYKKDCTINLDYQFGSFKNDTGKMGLHIKKLGIDVGYQYTMFPEIKSEFDRSHLLTTSIGETQ